MEPSTSGRRRRRSDGSKRAWQTLVLTCVIAVTSVQSSAAPGDLDPTFADHGVAVHDLTPRWGAVEDVSTILVRPDGRIVAAGISYADRPAALMTLLQFLPDGTRDDAFGDHGMVQLSIGEYATGTTNAVLQPDGKIVLSGAGLPRELAVVRVLADGSPDPSFGNGGLAAVAVPVFSIVGGARALALQSDGRIVLAATVCDEYVGCSYLTTRLTPSGTVDESFGIAGFTMSPPGFRVEAKSVAIAGDGRIVLLGQSASGPDVPELALMRLDADGLLDTTFGVQGVARTSLGYGGWTSAITVLRDGRIVTAGAQAIPVRHVVLLTRHLADGSLDPTFGTAGIVTSDYEDESSATSIAVQSDGKLLVTGETTKSQVHGFHVERFLDDGSLDPGFGDAGVAHTSIAGLEDLSHAVALQNDGRILVGGRAALGDYGNPAFAVARYLGGATTCGNGTLDAGETCDDGNLRNGDCCSSRCVFESAGTTCTDDANGCTTDVCDGGGRCTHPANSASCDDGLFCNGADSCSSGACSAHAGDPCTGGTECARSCDETRDACNAPAGTSCTDDGSVCSSDVCDGSGACIHPAAHPGTVCRAATAECDLAETCSGTSPQCPADAHVVDGTACTADALPCTSDQCRSGACTHAPGNAGATCRPSSGECDVAEACTGTSPQCPADGHVPDGSSCTPDALRCTTDVCSDGACSHPPGNGGTTCRVAAGECDVAEACTGTSAECPADLHVNDDTPCTMDALICTRDVCGGGACTHPAGNAGVTCRASSGECDVAEQCDGASVECPVDARAEAGTSCMPDAETCTADVCDGRSTSCTHPPGNTGVVCREAVGACDVAETCDGVTGACPVDTGVPDTDADGTCDAEDECTNVAGGRTFVTSPRAKLVLARVNTDRVPGNDKLALSASFDLPPGTSFADLEPQSDGARVVLEGANGERPLDVVLPRGAWSPVARYGWKLSGSGAAWTWLDRRSARPAGIVKLSVTDRGSSTSPRRVKIVVTGRDGFYPITAASTPVRATVALGDAAAGVCGESAFTRFDCGFNGARNQLACTR